jgi:hypothetical protein
MEQKQTDIRIRSLSEDFYSRSPNTQSIVKYMIGAIPTSSKCVEEQTNIEEYITASPTTQYNMVAYCLVPHNITLKVIPK